MSRRKMMSTILLIVAIVVFAIAFGVWWHLFFGRPNPPLRQTSVTIQQSSTAPATGSTTISVATGTTAATDTAIHDTSTPGPDQIAIDGAVFNVEIASTTLEQTRGLSYRPSLGAQDGMLFIFGAGSVQTFWMKDMHFPLDMIWISGTKIVGFAQDVPAPAPGTPLWSLPIYSSPPNTDKVLEVNAGTVAKYNIKVGDAVKIGS